MVLGMGICQVGGWASEDAVELGKDRRHEGGEVRAEGSGFVGSLKNGFLQTRGGRV